MEVICYATGKNENPENSVIGIEHCLKVNSNWWIEMDVQITKDKELVLFHDYDLIRTTGMNGIISNFNYSDLSELNIGCDFMLNIDRVNKIKESNIPLLEHVLKSYPEANFIFDIHSNDPSIVDLFIDLIEKVEFTPRFVVGSEYEKVISEMRKKRAFWTYAASAREAKSLIVSSWLQMDKYFPLHSDILCIPLKFGKVTALTDRIIHHVQSKGKKLWVWMYEGKTARTIQNMNQYQELKSRGIDGVFTDSPELLFTEMKTE
ncbi:MAG: glycerophosphodiester phosphodiesterase family protein [Saprospiraceae bacterium]|nr:glycerophosphodiester phosphodiesterase family protein [Saprospiraceae bacterium]|tara:strand:- start:96 stop:881 length:786 start_codon:yes stop_codon:yes gene_type:complete